MTRLNFRLFGALGAASLLAACASTPSPTAAPAPRAPLPPPVAATPAPAPAAVAVPARERVRRAMEMLGRGEAQLAKAELTAALTDPSEIPVARKLLDEIDRDPRALLGERNYPYRIRPGESLSSLAERFLGDPLLFYALARYNGIDAPDSAEVGRLLLIPGTPRKVVPAAPPPKVAVAPPPSGANPARANLLRRRALEDMSKGSVDVAVALLQQAMPLDPANPLIKGDLDRALRIQASLKRK